ncbi:hypothetical protein HZB03_01385 [Candidatus Woesearchaeota archaeon]|nr:hypothetical protein [Candidatus Woesearchaeota archaeon]
MKRMLRKLAIVVLLLIITTTTAIGAEIFNQYVYDNDVFSISGVNHSLKYYPGNGKVSLHAGEAIMIFAVGACKKLGTREYCIDDANTTEIDDEEGYRVVGRTSLRVTEIVPALSVSAGVDKSVIGVNEPATLTITIENTGEERASDVEVRALVPIQATITGSSVGMASLGSQVIWKGTLLPGEKKTIESIVKGLQYKDFDVTFESSYYFDGKTTPITVDPLHIKVVTPIEIETGLSQESVILNEESAYLVNITNNDATSALEVSQLLIAVPAGLIITEKSQEFKQSNNQLTTSTSVAKGATKEFYVKIKTFDKGKYNITSTVKSFIHETAFDDSSVKTLRVGLADIVPSIDIAQERGVGGDSVTVTITIKNAGSRDISLYDLDVASNLIPAIQKVNESIALGGSKTVYSKSIKLPAVARETSYFVRVSGSHKNLAGSPMQFEAQKNLIVTPKETLIQVIPEASINGGSVKVNVKLKILKEKLTDVSIIDIVPKGISTVGKRDADFDSVEMGEEKDALNYTIILPLTYNQKTLTIQRSLSAEQANGKLYTIETEVIIDLASQPKTESQNDSQNATAVQVSQEKNTSQEKNESVNETITPTANPLELPSAPESPKVLTRVWNRIKEFFTVLF